MQFNIKFLEHQIHLCAAKADHFICSLMLDELGRLRTVKLST